MKGRKITCVDSKTDLSEDSDAEIYITSQKLNGGDHAKYLGTLIDNKVSWYYHINDVRLKISKGTGLLELGIMLLVVF